jgi:hypothetical protein
MAIPAMSSGSLQQWISDNEDTIMDGSAMTMPF